MPPRRVKDAYFYRFTSPDADCLSLRQIAHDQAQAVFNKTYAGVIMAMGRREFKAADVDDDRYTCCGVHLVNGSAVVTICCDYSTGQRVYIDKSADLPNYIHDILAEAPREMPRINFMPHTFIIDAGIYVWKCKCDSHKTIVKNICQLAGQSLLAGHQDTVAMLREIGLGPAKLTGYNDNTIINARWRANCKRLEITNDYFADTVEYRYGSKKCKDQAEFNNHVVGLLHGPYLGRPASNLAMALASGDAAAIFAEATQFIAATQIAEQIEAAYEQLKLVRPMQWN